MSSNIKVQRICEHCGQEFTARTTITRFCSHKCNSAFYKAKVKAGKIETSNRQTQVIRTQPVELLKSKDFLTIAETCKVLSVSRWTIWRAINQKDIVPGKIGRRVLIRRSDLENFFQTSFTIKIAEEPKDFTRNVKNPSKPLKIEISECYSTGEVREKFNISEAALRNLIIKHKIPKVRKGWYAYVPKTAIDNIFVPE